MNYKRRKPKPKKDYLVEECWGYKKSSKVDYRQKKKFKQKVKNKFLNSYPQALLY